VRNKGREYKRVSKTGEKENLKCHRTLKDNKFIKYNRQKNSKNNK